MAATATALTVVERVESSAVVMALDARGQALVDLLPDAAAATRFRRVVIQALIKNPELLECTPDSVVLSVFEAAAQGLEPTGAAGGAHLVPYNVKVSKNPDRWEKRAQLIPDYRGVIRLVTKPPSEVVSLEARVVKEGDDFKYAEGTDAYVHHVPSLAAGRSEKATTHVYAIARLKNGTSIPDVMDRAAVERVQKRGRGSAFSPWATDWDEMGKKTVIKRISKVLPVRPEIRSILVREDELTGETDPSDAPTTAPAGPTKVSRLASRLAQTAPPETEEAEGEATWLDQAAPSVAEEPEESAEQLDLLATLQTAADASDLEGPANQEQLAELARVFAGWDPELVKDGIRVVYGRAAIGTPTAAQAQALTIVADSLGDGFREHWRTMVAQQAAGAQA